MEENQNCISALVEVCKDFIRYLKGLKEKGFISEAEYEKHSKNKITFIEKMGK
jgi:ribosomal protein S8